MSQSREKTIAKLYDCKRKPKTTTKVDGRTKEGREVYIADFRHDGQRYQIYASNLSDFYLKIDDAIKVLQEGTIKINTKNEISIKDAFNVFLTEYRMPKLQEYSEKKKVKSYKQSFGHLDRIKTFCNSRNLINFSEIDNQVIREFIIFLRSLNLTNTTINRNIESFSSCFSYIKNNTEHEVSGFRLGLHKQKQPPPRTNYLTEEQIKKLISVSPKYLQNIINFLGYTGLRKESITVKWSNINFERRIITLQTKQNKTHTVPIVSKLFDLLQEIKKEQENNPNEYVFLYKGKPLSDPDASLTSALKNANIKLPKGQKFHIFRHTSATTLVNSGVDLSIVQQILGHSTPSMTQKYAHLKTQTMLDKMEGVFGDKKQDG